LEHLSDDSVSLIIITATPYADKKWVSQKDIFAMLVESGYRKYKHLDSELLKKKIKKN